MPGKDKKVQNNVEEVHLDQGQLLGGGSTAPTYSSWSQRWFSWSPWPNLFDKTIGMPVEGINPICVPKIGETTHHRRPPTSLHGL